MSPHRRTAALVMLAILGIALAAAITWGTSQLVRQRIGLASEPLTSGRRLLPLAGGAAIHAKRPTRSTSTTPVSGRTSPSTTSGTGSSATTPSPTSTGSGGSRTTSPRTGKPDASGTSNPSSDGGDSSAGGDD